MFEDVFCFVLPKICSSTYRQQLTVALMMHFSQQFSGINAVSNEYSIQLNFGLILISFCPLRFFITLRISLNEPVSASRFTPL